MRYLILLLFSLLIFPVNKPNFLSDKKYLKVTLSSKGLSKSNLNLYKSILTGNKRLLRKDVLKKFKRFGLLHLLTPSGLHLSSLLGLVFFLGLRIRLIILTVSLVAIIQFKAYLSLERVLLFQIIATGIKFFKLRLSLFFIFLLTFMGSVIIGNFTKSPLSFFYSFLFWGTIILYGKNKRMLPLYLFLSLLFSNILMSQSTSLLSLFLNPIMTALMTLIFPILFINALLGGIEFINIFLDCFLTSYTNIFNFFLAIDIIPVIHFSLPSFFIFSTLLMKKHYKFALVFIFLLPVPTLKINIPSKVKNIINLGHKNELISNRRLDFIDQRCSIKRREVSCTKKPSHLGGPSF